MILGNISGIDIIYDKRIKIGHMRLDKSRKFFRMNPKTKPVLDKVIFSANSSEPVFKRMHIPSTMPIEMQMNPPIIMNVEAS